MYFPYKLCVLQPLRWCQGTSLVFSHGSFSAFHTEPSTPHACAEKAHLSLGAKMGAVRGRGVPGGQSPRAIGRCLLSRETSCGSF